MEIAQRGTSATGKTGSGIYTVDRMALGIDSLGTWTVTQESLTSGAAYNAGFKKAFRIDCTTADASPASSDNIFFQYKLEGQDLKTFRKGTSSAKQFTLQFWVKSNKTGTGQVLLQDKDNNRFVGKTYTISSANTWEQKILTFPADTTGAFDNDNNKTQSGESGLSKNTVGDHETVIKDDGDDHVTIDGGGVSSDSESSEEEWEEVWVEQPQLPKIPEKEIFRTSVLFDSLPLNALLLSLLHTIMNYESTHMRHLVYFNVVLTIIILSLSLSMRYRHQVFGEYH